MKIKSLEMINFMMFANEKIDFDYANTDIYGDNATGKTTIFTAIMWLLFDKDCENKADFGIKRRVNGLEMSKAEHEVTAVFDINGVNVTLKKVYHENWAKPHGKLELEFKGNTSDYFIDGVPKTATAYKKYISEICNEETFKLVTNPRYFNEVLSWEKRRQILLEICGIVTNEEVITTNKAFEEIPKILGSQNLEDVKAILKAEVSKIKKEVVSIPARISENTRAMTEQKTPCEEVQALVVKFEEGIKVINNQIAEINNGGKDIALKKRLVDVRSNISLQKQAINEATDKAKKTLTDAIAEFKLEQGKLIAKQYKLTNMKEAFTSEIAKCKQQKTVLLAMYSSEKARTWAGDEICPTCGQKMPESEIEKAKESFNLTKAENLQKITNEGKANNENKTKAEESLVTVTAEEAENEEKANALQLQIQGLQDKLNKIIPESTLELGKLLQEEVNILAGLAAPDEEKEEKITELEKEKSELIKELADKRDILAEINTNKNLEKRIEELKTQEKSLNVSYEEASRKLFLIQSFEKRLVELTTSKVASKFKLARFNLFKNNISNEGIEACCEVTFNSVPYKGLNNAMRTNIGLDIINTLQAHYGFNAPIIIDNAESVTKLIEMGETQVIRLIVSENDKSLRIEKGE